jgi:hypothetical protein
VSAELLTILKTWIEEVREDGLSEGEIALPGPGKQFDGTQISLARFQSYRGRTTAALLEELEDLCAGAKTLKFKTTDILVWVTVQ